LSHDTQVLRDVTSLTFTGLDVEKVQFEGRNDFAGLMRPGRTGRMIPEAERSRYKTYVTRADTELQSNNHVQLSGMHGTGLLINNGHDIWGWRHPLWLIRNQMQQFGNYVEGLEEMPIPHPGGYQWYAMFSRNQLKIAAVLEKQGFKFLTSLR